MLFRSDLGYDQILVVAHDGILKVLHTVLENMPLTDAIKVYHENASAYSWDMTQKLQ